MGRRQWLVKTRPHCVYRLWVYRTILLELIVAYLSLAYIYAEEDSLAGVCIALHESFFLFILFILLIKSKEKEPLQNFNWAFSFAPHILFFPTDHTPFPLVDLHPRMPTISPALALATTSRLVLHRYIPLYQMYDFDCF